MKGGWIRELMDGSRSLAKRRLGTDGDGGLVRKVLCTACDIQGKDLFTFIKVPRPSFENKCDIQRGVRCLREDDEAATAGFV